MKSETVTHPLPTPFSTMSFVFPFLCQIFILASLKSATCFIRALLGVEECFHVDILVHCCRSSTVDTGESLHRARNSAEFYTGEIDELRCNAHSLVFSVLVMASFLGTKVNSVRFQAAGKSLLYERQLLCLRPVRLPCPPARPTGASSPRRIE